MMLSTGTIYTIQTLIILVGLGGEVHNMRSMDILSLRGQKMFQAQLPIYTFERVCLKKFTLSEPSILSPKISINMTAGHNSRYQVH